MVLEILIFSAWKVGQSNEMASNYRKTETKMDPSACVRGPVRVSQTTNHSVTSLPTFQGGQPLLPLALSPVTGTIFEPWSSDEKNGSGEVSSGVIRGRAWLFQLAPLSINSYSALRGMAVVYCWYTVGHNRNNSILEWLFCFMVHSYLVWAIVAIMNCDIDPVINQLNLTYKSHIFLSTFPVQLLWIYCVLPIAYRRFQ